MDFTQLDKLMKVKKKSDASKQDKKAFQDEWLKLVKEQGYSNKAENYLYEGAGFCGIKPFKIYFDSSSDKGTLLRKFISGNKYSENQSCTFRLMIHFLGLLLNDPQHDISMVKFLIIQIPRVSINKENKIIGDIQIIFKKYFVSVLNPSVEFPKWDDLNLDNQIIVPFCEVFLYAVSKIDVHHIKQEGVTNLNKIVAWIESAHCKMKRPAPVDLPKETKVLEADAVVKLSKLQTMLENVEIERNQLLEKVSRLEHKLQEKEDLIREKELISTHLQDQVAMLMKEMINLKMLNEKLNNTISEDKVKINDNSKMMDIIRADSEKQIQIRMNQIAAQLKLDYQDYLVTMDKPMDNNIGEFLKDTIEHIFKMLEKNGIRLT